MKSCQCGKDACPTCGVQPVGDVEVSTKYAEKPKPYPSTLRQFVESRSEWAGKPTPKAPAGVRMHDDHEEEGFETPYGEPRGPRDHEDVKPVGDDTNHQSYIAAGKELNKAKAAMAMFHPTHPNHKAWAKKLPYLQSKFEQAKSDLQSNRLGKVEDAEVKPVRVNPAPMVKTVPVSKAKHVKDDDVRPV